MSGTLPFPVGLLPSLQGRLSKLISTLVLPGSFRLVGAYTRVCGLYLPVEKAVELVTTLKVEPGGKVWLMARLSSGCRGSFRYRLSIRLSWALLNVAYLFGLKVG